MALTICARVVVEETSADYEAAPESATLPKNWFNFVLMTRPMYISIHRLWLTAEVKEWACAESTSRSMHQDAPKIALVALILRSQLNFGYVFFDSAVSMTEHAAARFCMACSPKRVSRATSSKSLAGNPGQVFQRAGGHLNNNISFFCLGGIMGG